jgi:pSer/pThr/pTyr-binding forkhead associated (FHA) protein
VTSIDNLARTAYEAHRGSHPETLPPWEDAPETERKAWRAAVTAVAGKSGVTLAESVPTQTLILQVGDRRDIFHTDFTAGRQGTLVIDDEFASGHHARFHVAHELWYVEDLDSTNGTWLNGRRILAAQRLQRGDKVRIGHTVAVVLATTKDAEKAAGRTPSRGRAAVRDYLGRLREPPV